MTTPVKIAHVTLSMGVGGIERLILDLCRHADREKFELSVICLDEAGALFSELEPMGVTGIVEKRARGFDWSLIVRLVSLFKDMQVQVVHSHNQASAFYAGIAAFLARVPASIVTEHSRNYIETRLIRRIEKSVLSLLLDKWVHVSRELATASCTRERISSSKVETFVNGVDWAPFLKPDPCVVGELQETYRLDSRHKNIVMVARLDKIKKHDMMIDALDLLVKEKQQVRLLLVGDGNCRHDLEVKVKRLDLEDRVRFLGFNKSIPEILALSDVFVLCSHSEGLPLSLLEASAGNVPVVITENSNGAGFINNMEKGIVVKDEAASLAGGIKQCLSDYGQAKKMSATAQQDVMANYSLNVTVRQYEQLYLELLTGKRRACA